MLQTYEAQEQRALEVLHLRYDETGSFLSWVWLGDGHARTDAEERDAGGCTGHDRPDAERPPQAYLIKQSGQDEGKCEALSVGAYVSNLFAINCPMD